MRYNSIVFVSVVYGNVNLFFYLTISTESGKNNTEKTVDKQNGLRLRGGIF